MSDPKFKGLAETRGNLGQEVEGIDPRDVSFMENELRRRGLLEEANELRWHHNAHIFWHQIAGTRLGRIIQLEALLIDKQKKADAMLALLDRAIRRLEIEHETGGTIMRGWARDARAVITKSGGNNG